MGFVTKNRCFCVGEFWLKIFTKASAVKTSYADTTSLSDFETKEA